MLAGAGAFLALSVGSSAPALGTGIETVHRIGASLFASDIAVDAACGALACGTAEICYGIDTLKVRSARASPEHAQTMAGPTLWHFRRLGLLSQLGPRLSC